MSSLSGQAQELEFLHFPRSVFPGEGSMVGSPVTPVTVSCGFQPARNGPQIQSPEMHKIRGNWLCRSSIRGSKINNYIWYILLPFCWVQFGCKLKLLQFSTPFQIQASVVESTEGISVEDLLAQWGVGPRTMGSRTSRIPAKPGYISFKKRSYMMELHQKYGNYYYDYIRLYDVWQFYSWSCTKLELCQWFFGPWL